MDLNLKAFLSQQRTTILDKWLQLALKTYPPETARFLREEKDQFANPVGHTIYQAIAGLYEEILQGMDAAKVDCFLDKIIRIKAAQGFSPSQAVTFVYFLKKVVRAEVESKIREGELTWDEVAIFESQIDDLALLSFDIYMKCREKIDELRINEVRNRTYRLLQKAQMMVGDPEPETNLQDQVSINQSEKGGSANGH